MAKVTELKWGYGKEEYIGGYEYILTTSELNYLIACVLQEYGDKDKCPHGWDEYNVMTKVHNQIKYMEYMDNSDNFETIEPSIMQQLEDAGCINNGS